MKRDIMVGFTDIHNHGLPGIDDGAATLEEALEMIKICYADGIRRIIYTPHYHPGRYKTSSSMIKTSYQNLMEEAKKYEFYSDMEFYLGSEIYYTSDCIDKLSEKHIETLADSSYILVEFSPTVDFPYIKSACNNLIFNGYLPILAHVERYNCLFNKWSNIDELINMSVYMQVNTAAIIGDMGFLKKAFVKKLLKKEYVSFIGTDSHGAIERTPNMKNSVRYIEKKIDKSYFDRITKINPIKIIKNEYI